MESDAGALFEFFLLQPTGLFRQQLAELEIRFTQPIHLGGLDSIAKKFQDLGTPFVTLRFVLTDDDAIVSPTQSTGKICNRSRRNECSFRNAWIDCHRPRSGSS
jgi:hypothetical protein